MRVVVIGGTRFVGPCVVRDLRRAGHIVTVFHRGAKCQNGSHVHDDVLNLGRHRLRADVVINLWAMTPQHARALMDAKIARRHVIISSCDVYRQYDYVRRAASGPPDPTPLTETSPLRATRFPYGDIFPGYEKILVEQAVPGATILRLTAVYGPHDEQHRLRPWLRDPVLLAPGQSNWRWTRVYTENAAHAIVCAATDDRAAGRTYNVGEPDSPTEAEWVRMLGHEPREDPAANVPPFDWRYDLTIDSSAIRHDLGYTERVSRPDALAATAAWETTTT